MISASLRASAAALALALCAAGPSERAAAQEDAAEVLEIVRSLAPRAGQTEAPRYIADRVHFEYASSRLTAAARAQLDLLARAMRASGLAGMRFRVEGHTDSRGAAAYNMALSERRARAAARYLSAAGIAAGRLDAVGRGETELRDPVNPESAVNRRVEIATLAPPPAARAPDPPRAAPAPVRPAPARPRAPAPPPAAGASPVMDALTGGSATDDDGFEW